MAITELQDLMTRFGAQAAWLVERLMPGADALAEARDVALGLRAAANIMDRMVELGNGRGPVEGDELAAVTRQGPPPASSFRLEIRASGCPPQDWSGYSVVRGPEGGAEAARLYVPPGVSRTEAEALLASPRAVAHLAEREAKWRAGYLHFYPDGAYCADPERALADLARLLVEAEDRAERLELAVQHSIANRVPLTEVYVQELMAAPWGEGGGSPSGPRGTNGEGL